MAEIEDLKKENKELKDRLHEINSNPEISAFYALRKMLSQQTKRLNKFDLEREISQNSKEDKVYERTMDIVIKMPKMISELNALRSEMKLSGDERKDTEDMPFIESIAETRK